LKSTTTISKATSYVVTSAVGHLVEIQAPEEFDVKRGKWSFATCR
jgi:DNA topoisomerase-3